MLFLLRTNSNLAAELFRYIQLGPSPAFEKFIAAPNAFTDRSHLRFDHSLIEAMTQLLLDNPFPDTSQTVDTNLPYFNTLRAYQKMLAELPETSKQAQDLNRVNNITSKEDLKDHITLNIFNSLIKSVEAQSYLRFIFKGIFSKINLIQLIAFINEKEA